MKRYSKEEIDKKIDEGIKNATRFFKTKTIEIYDDNYAPNCMRKFGRDLKKQENKKWNPSVKP